MGINVAEQIAEVGLNLSRLNSLDICARMLVDSATQTCGAKQAGFAGSRQTLGGVMVGDFPVEAGTSNEPCTGALGEIEARYGEWFCLCMRGVGSGEPWTARLWARIDESRREEFEPVSCEKMLQVLARQASLAIDLVLRRRHHRERENQQNELIEAGKELALEHTVDGVLRLVADKAVRLARARYGALAVGGGDDGHDIVEMYLPSWIKSLPSNAPQDFSAGRLPEASLNSQSFSVPFVNRTGNISGRIYLFDKTDEKGDPSTFGFNTFDQHMVMTLASQAGIAIEGAQYSEQLVSAAKKLAEANRRLEELDQQKSAFLANVSHELRTPLNTILGYTRLLSEDADNLTSEQKDDLDIVLKSGAHLLRMISDLLDMSRIEAGRMELKVEEIDAVAIAREVVAAILPQVAPGVRLESEMPDSLIAECDPGRIRQVLFNVLGNAAKFTTAGMIRLRLSQVEDTVEFLVEDTGPGIPSIDLERIFESFFQSDAAQARTPRASEGAGLGLAITRQLVHLHGGSVEIDSNEGQGTRVRIMIPLEVKGGV